jgi:hypothetical protein
MPVPARVRIKALSLSSLQAAFRQVNSSGVRKSCGLILEDMHVVLHIDYDIDIKWRYDFGRSGNSKWHTK